MTKPDRQAFPGDYINSGLTKREYFAAAAMQGYIAGRSSSMSVFPENVANVAVQCADELIKALNKQ